MKVCDSQVVTLASDGTVVILDRQEGGPWRLCSVLHWPHGPPGKVNSLETDSDWLAVQAYYNEIRGPRFVEIWRRQEPVGNLIFPEDYVMAMIVLAPYLMTANRQKGFKMWDMTTKTVVRSL